MSYGSLFSRWKWEKRVLSRCSKHGATVLPIGAQPLADVSCWSWPMVFWRARVLPLNPSYRTPQVCKATTNSELPLTQDGALSSGLVLSFSSPSCGVLWHTPLAALDAKFYSFTFWSSPVFSASEYELQACWNAFIVHKQIFPSVGLFFM